MKPTSLRRIMLVRLAKRCICPKKTFRLCAQEIPMTEKDVSHIMDIPIQGEDIYKHTEGQGSTNMDLFNAYQTDNRLMLTTLETLIKTSTTPDDHFIRHFVLYAIGIILAPTANDYVDRKYLALVKDVADIPKFNWGCFTLAHLFDSIRNFQYLDRTSLQGNLPLLQVSVVTVKHNQYINSTNIPMSKFSILTTTFM